METYNPDSEFALKGDDAGWTATHSDPAASSSRAEAEDIPCLEDHDEPPAKDDDEIPDINELNLGDKDDEVRRIRSARPLPIMAS